MGRDFDADGLPAELQTTAARHTIRMQPSLATDRDTLQARYANELVAMRAAGMSLQRIMTPYIGLAVGLAALIAGAQEFLAPQAQRNLELMRSAIDGDEDPSEVAAPAVDIYHQSKGHVWNIDAFHRNEERMRGVDVQWTTSDGRSIRIIADSATWDGRQWIFEQGREFQTA